MLSPHFIAQTVVTYPSEQRGMIMSVIVWLVVGLIAGFLGSKIVNKRGEGMLMDIVLGLVGSFVGGFLFSLVGIRSGGLIFSIVVATIGAIVVLLIYHKLIRGNRTA